MRILKIDASANPNGNSRVLTQYLVENLAEQHGSNQNSAEIIIRDVASDPLPTMSAETLMAFYTYSERNDVSEDVKHHLALSEKLIEELKSADVVVLGVPMYNFGIPAHLRNWIDHVARQGVTFRYGENGPEGLIGSTRVYLVATSGGTPIGGAADHSSTHATQVFGFLGATQIEVIDAGGSKGAPDVVIAAAKTQIDETLQLAQSA